MTQEEFHKRYQYSPTKDCLGEGGFGKVYKAYDTHRDRFVAIKMAEVRPHLEEVRLRKEVEIISKLPSHPNIAYYEECYTFSTFAGKYDFGILQYYDEGNLQQLLTDKQLSYEQKDSLLRQILEGIVFLHSQGIIHRDLKPQNILIVNRNGKYIPKITDFGISKKLDENKSSIFTNSLAGAGTLSFASPEQLMGNTIRKNTDIWSFGVITFWAFTGKLPFNIGKQTLASEAGRIELYRQITSGEVTALIQQLPSVWQKVVKQCIIVDIEKRIGSASQCLGFFSNKSTNETKIESATEIVETNINTMIDNELITTVSQINDPNKKKKEKIKISILRNRIIRLTFIVLSILLVITVFSIVTSNHLRLNKETVKDIDGNIYHTVTIGNQTWMIENLNTTRYRNGEQIPYVKEESQWISTTQGAFCYPNNSLSYAAEYGRIYNWYAVVDYRKIAPKGWRVPTDSDYTILEKNFKKFGFNHDLAETENIFTEAIGSISNMVTSIFIRTIGNDKTKSNAYYFTKMNASRLGPRPNRFLEQFKPNPIYLGRSNAMWSSSQYFNGYSWWTDLTKGHFSLRSETYLKTDGLSVRCIKDN